MTSSHALSLSAVRAPRRSVFRLASLAAVSCVLTSALLAQVDPNAPGANGGRARRQNQNGGADATAGNANGNGGRQGGRGKFDPAQAQEQLLLRLREQFGVTDDAEWKVISDRMTALTEARRAGGPGGPGGGGGFAGAFRGGPGGGGGGGGQGGRGGRGGSPEADALRQAVTDNLPEAEIKSRLERLRESRKASEEKVAKAQEELRAVLSVKQEAVAVVFGLLP